MIRGMTALVALLCSAGMARAECTVPAWRFLNGQQTNASMTTSSGAACSLIFRHTRGIAGAEDRPGNVRQQTENAFKVQAMRPDEPVAQ